VTWALIALCWAGWAVALAAVWTLRRRMDRVADAEHELRGAATAIGLAAEPSPLLRLELDRLTAALADLAQARGARAAAPADLEAGRLAQVLGNVAANAAEHGVGRVEVHARRDGQSVELEVSNADRPAAGEGGTAAGRGRGLLIAKRAARELGGRLTLQREGGRTRVVLRLPDAPEAGAAPDGRLPGAPDADASRDRPPPEEGRRAA
jgi:C4-dicarboxylate-specific signal transduction histidine kinase